MAGHLFQNSIAVFDAFDKSFDAFDKSFDAFDKSLDAFDNHRRRKQIWRCRGPAVLREALLGK